MECPSAFKHYQWPNCRTLLTLNSPILFIRDVLKRDWTTHISSFRMVVWQSIHFTGQSDSARGTWHKAMLQCWSARVTGLISISDIVSGSHRKYSRGETIRNNRLKRGTVRDKCKTKRKSKFNETLFSMCVYFFFKIAIVPWLSFY